MSEKVKHKEKNQKKYFNDFLKGMEQVASASQKILEISREISDVDVLLKAEDKLHDLPVKAFGDGGSHIVIRGNHHIGKQTNVIIKKNKGGGI